MAAPTRFRIVVPLLAAQFTGTGDLMAALLLAWTHRHPDRLQDATENAIASVQAVLRRTFAHYGAAAALAPTFATAAAETAFRRRMLELQLVQSKRDLEHPVVELRATLLVPDSSG